MTKRTLIAYLIGGGLLVGGGAAHAAGAGAYADYNGDGYPDFAVWTPSTGTFTWQAQGGSAKLTKQLGANGDMPVVGDWNGDGRSDFAVWRPSTGYWYVSRTSDGVLQQQQWGMSGDVPVPADYDGDGKTDYAVWRPSNGTWYIIKSTTGAGVGIQWGVAGDIPVPADYDGDGKIDTAVWRPADGKWYVIPSTGTGAYWRQWGMAGDIPVPGDHDGDGKADVTVNRGGAWITYFAATNTSTSVTFGVSSDIPLSGADFNHDRKADLVIFRPGTTGTFFVDSSAGVSAGLIGTNGDIPVTRQIASWSVGYVQSTAADQQTTGVSYWMIDANVAAGHLGFTGLGSSGQTVGTIAIDSSNKLNKLPATITVTQGSNVGQAVITSVTTQPDPDPPYAHVTIVGTLGGQAFTTTYTVDGSGNFIQGSQRTAQNFTKGGKTKMAMRGRGTAPVRAARGASDLGPLLAMNGANLAPIFHGAMVDICWSCLASPVKAAWNWGKGAVGAAVHAVDGTTISLFGKLVNLLGGNDCLSCSIQLGLLASEAAGCGAGVVAEAPSGGTVTPGTTIVCSLAFTDAALFDKNCPNFTSCIF